MLATAWTSLWRRNLAAEREAREALREAEPDPDDDEQAEPAPVPPGMDVEHPLVLRHTGSI